MTNVMHINMDHKSNCLTHLKGIRNQFSIFLMSLGNLLPDLHNSYGPDPPDKL